MKISVALATYNGQRFVKKQLESLLNQTRRPDEVIIIDDCSTDNTVNVVSDFISSNNLDWDIAVAESNQGYKRNFYNCLNKCTGDLIFLCDQDDEWYSEKIERIAAVFESDEDCLAVNSSFDMTDENGEVLVPFGSDKKNSANHGLIDFSIERGDVITVDLKTVLVYNISPGCTCCFKREAVEDYLAVSECRLPHDWELNIIAAKRGGLRFLNLPLIGYRQHGNNAIGLSTDDSFGPLKMRGNDDVRFKVLELQKAQADVVRENLDVSDKMQQRFSEKLTIFCENREKILYSKKLMYCFKNFLLYPNLKQVATIHFRGILGDIIYVIKHKGDKND